MRPIILIASLAVVLSVPAGAPAAATSAPAISVQADGLGARGYDVTAYFTSGKPVAGSTAFELKYQGATWRFASAANREKFKSDPAAFAPQFGGYCSWAVSQGYLAPGDPTQWKVVDGKLYLNFNARAKELWEADQDAAIARGHANWPKVLTENQDVK
jgi:YHS domain-containing protein